MVSQSTSDSRDAATATGEIAARPERLLTPQLYFNRELSWIDFNRRVLEEAANPRHPLLERVKFTAIFASNLDEFFMVRVAGVKEQKVAGVVDKAPDGLTPGEEMRAIRERLLPDIARHQNYFLETQVPELAAQGILLCNYRDLSAAEKRALRQYFLDEVFPVCTPLGLDPGHPFPLISNLSVNLAVVLEDPDGGRRFARVKVPNVLSRLVQVPASGAVTKFVWLEQLLAANLDALFPAMRIIEVHPFRVIRDADIEIQELEAADLLESVEATLSRRRFGSVIALMINPSMTARVRRLLIENLKLDPEDLYEVEGPLGLADTIELLRLNRPDLKDTPFVPRTPALLRGQADIFSVIRQQDLLLHHPYDSFATVVDFIQTAATDPQVLAIKMTLYRVGTQSPIVEALGEAADSGKQVAVLVELKARFDEENNIEWARALERAGVHVTYGLVGLKTHCKLALVVRKERDGLRRYVHIGTGNYNPATARLYTDVGLLTANPDIGADVGDVFNYLTGYSRQTTYRKLLVAPVNLRRGIRDRIERETFHARRRGHGHMILKMNSLVDPDLIEALYQASQAGVKIDLLVRGICCLRPDVPGVSDNIRVISIVGRFLEHSRIFYFENAGDSEVLIGSADLMPRNLDHRVEVIVPVEAADLRRMLVDDVLAVYLADNVQARELRADGTYVRRTPASDDFAVDAQAVLVARALADAEVHVQTPSAAPSPYGRIDRYG